MEAIKKQKKPAKYVIRNGVDASCDFSVVSYPFPQVMIQDEGETVIDVKTGLFVRAFSNVDAALAASKKLNDALNGAKKDNETRGRKKGVSGR